MNTRFRSSSSVVMAGFARRHRRRRGRANTRRDPAAVISGSDIGFRPEGWNGKARTGTWLCASQRRMGGGAGRLQDREPLGDDADASRESALPDVAA
jgi:hypothetical protein